MTGIGPFSVPTATVALAALLAWLVARFAVRGTDPAARRAGASVVVDALFAGLVAARLAYVLQWWPEYGASPLSIVAIGDGGFNPWIGLPVGLLWGLWRTRRYPPHRRPMLIGVAAGVALWGAAQIGLNVMQRSAPPLPALTVQTPDGRPIALESFRGSPVVLNLWASWCPPCRREMPVLAQAQADYPNVRFLMVNQGETASVVSAFVQSQGLHFDHLLLDPTSETMRAAGSRGLPTTLFFAPDGRLVDAHLGELTAARLRDTLQGGLHQTPAPRVQNP